MRPFSAHSLVHNQPVRRQEWAHEAGGIPLGYARIPSLRLFGVQISERLRPAIANRYFERQSIGRRVNR
jgi:hypothetical protein